MKQENLPKELSVTLNPKGLWLVILLFLVLYGLFVGVAIWNDQPLFLPITVGTVLLICPIGIFLSLSAAKVIIDADGVTLRIFGFVLRRIPHKNVRLLIHHQGYKHLTTMLVLSASTQEELEARGKHALENKTFVRSELRFMSARSDWQDICLCAGLGTNLLPKHCIWVEFSPERQRLLESLFPNCPCRISNDYRNPSVPMGNK